MDGTERTVAAIDLCNDKELVSLSHFVADLSSLWRLERDSQDLRRGEG